MVDDASILSTLMLLFIKWKTLLKFFPATPYEHELKCIKERTTFLLDEGGLIELIPSQRSFPLTPSRHQILQKVARNTYLERGKYCL
jgi:hypothetical protein